MYVCVCNNNSHCVVAASVISVCFACLSLLQFRWIAAVVIVVVVFFVIFIIVIASISLPPPLRSSISFPPLLPQLLPVLAVASSFRQFRIIFLLKFCYFPMLPLFYRHRCRHNCVAFSKLMCHYSCPSFLWNIWVSMCWLLLLIKVFFILKFDFLTLAIYKVHYSLQYTPLCTQFGEIAVAYWLQFILSADPLYKLM